MKIYNDTLEIMKKKLEDFIKRYEGLDTIEPFSYNIFEALKVLLETETKNLTKTLSKIKTYEQAYDDSFNSLSQEYTKKEKELEVTLRNSVKEVVTKNIECCKKIRLEIEEKKKATKAEENNSLMDIEFFFIASEQNVDLFEREYNDNISRYSYQFSIAKDSYANNTILFNNTLEQDLRDLEAEYNRVLIDYDMNTEKIIEHYRNNEAELNKIYSEKLTEFDEIQNQNKAARRQESMETNNKIRAIATDRSDKIAQAKQEYAKKQAEAQSDKEAKRQEFQMENQKISREFIANMSSLDEQTNYLKEKYTNNIDSEKRLLFYKLLELKKEEEHELEAIYSSTEVSKKDIKNIKNQYYRYSILERKNTDKTLKNLNNSYLIDVEKTQYQRKLLDIDRNYDIKAVLEHESYNNKIFQENNNEYENEMNVQIKFHNLEYNKKANDIRKENTIKSLRDEKKFDEIEALHSIETEKLLTQIKTIKYEVDSFEEIRKLLHSFEDEKYKLTFNFKTVNNVLEIEKCKVLDTLNRSMYDLKVKSSKMIFDTSKESAALRNKEYEQKVKAQINRNKLLLENEEKKAAYKIECLKREEEYEIETLNRNYYYELDSLGHTFLSDKFIIEFKKIMQHLSVTSLLIKDATILCASSLDYVFKNAIFRPQYLPTLRQFLKEFTALVFEQMHRFIGNLHTILDEIITERLNFEESLKYKGFYKNIEVQHKEDVGIQEEKKNEIIKKIDSINYFIDENRKQISEIENNLIAIREKIKKESNSYKLYKDEILKYQNERRELESENIKNSKRILALTKELNHIDNQIAQLNLSFSRQQDDIKKLQLTNAQAYTELKRNIDRHIDIYVSDISSKFKIPESQEFEFADYTSIVRQRYEANLEITNDFLTDIYAIINKFADNEREAIKKAADILDNGYITDLSELDRDAKNEASSAEAIFLRDDNQRLEDLQKFDKLTLDTERAMKQEIKDHENLIKKYNNDIVNEINAANRLFYDDYYSICANQQDIINMQKSNIDRLTENYEKNRQTIIDRFNVSKDALKKSLNEFVMNQNEVLEHLPTAVKEQEKTINDEALKTLSEMDQAYLDIKNSDSTTKKEIKKNKLLIEQAFIVKQDEMALEHKVKRVKEKKEHLTQMRHIPQ